MTLHSATTTTPDGPFSVIADGEVVLASGWTHDVAALLALVHPTLRSEVTGASRLPALDAVDAYYAGDLAAPGRVAVRQVSGPFRMHAWDTLRLVAPGERITYSEYARRADNAPAVRAAAGACAMNAAALFVPCHRILRTDGSLGGFRYGLAIKQRLLEREGGLTPS